MTLQDYITSSQLANVVIELIRIDATFKDKLKIALPDVALDIESASLNKECSCKSKVVEAVVHQQDVIGTLLYNYTVDNKLNQEIEALFADVISKAGADISGRVAQTTIADWPVFAKSLQQSNSFFRHMSTSIVDDRVYVFFL